MSVVNRVKNWVHHTIEDVKAWRRGEVRIAPKGATGRVYAKKEGDQTPEFGGHNVRIEPIVELEMKIMRADGTVEYRKVPASIVRS